MRRALFVATVVVLGRLSYCNAVDRLPPADASVRRSEHFLAIHPDNPHCFLWCGEPTILISSGEHYGAVLNSSFDYDKYLRTLASYGFNHTRIFCGLYVEDNGSKHDGPQLGNTLDPAEGKLICPFARSNVIGYPKGGAKFDLQRWDEKFDTRLRHFVELAAELRIVVEVNLFCPYYGDGLRQWTLSPFNIANNINGVGKCRPNEVFSLETHDGLLPFQEAMVKHIVEQLRDFENVYYEICNEPYLDGISVEWQHHIADVIARCEQSFSQKHLISQNIANGKQERPIVDPHAAISIFNFHYASPDAVTMNLGLNQPIGDNETGFVGVADLSYRREAWRFLLAGGALFSHLDYSFTVGHEDGSFAIPSGQGGGGGPTIRNQLRCLAEFLHSFDFLRMQPDHNVVHSLVTSPINESSDTKSADKPVPIAAWVLAESGEQYAIYVDGGTKTELQLSLPAGRYSAQWLHPRTGQYNAADSFAHESGDRTFLSPEYTEDIALKVRRIGPIVSGVR